MEQNLLLSERLNELMSDNSINTDRVAIAIGVSEETVRYWKNGQHNIYLSNLIKLADYFSCSLDFLVGKSDILLDYIPKICPPFYQRLRELMEIKRISRYKLVKDTNIYDSYFTNWKKGSDVHVFTLFTLADVLNCSLDFLIGRDQ